MLSLLNPACLSVSVVVLTLTTAIAQPPETEEEPSKPGDGQVIIKREPLVLVNPIKYQVPMKLKPIRELRVTPVRAGVVETVQVKPNDVISAQAVVVQMERKSETLDLEIARHELDLAKLVLTQTTKLSETGGSSSAEVAVVEARMKTAEARFKLAELHVDETLLRVPFAAKIFRVPVAPGQFVQPGETLLTAADVSALTVEVPVDRNSAKVGEAITVRVEDQTVQATIQAVLPLAEELDALRELFPSVASATVVLKNDAGNLLAGQTVYSEMIPREPVTEVPNTTLKNLTGEHPEDHRKVQVIRDFVVRDVEVKLLGQVGNDRTYVTGKFQQGDEVITSSTQPLADGTQVRPGVPPARSPSTDPKTPGSNPTRTNF